MRAKIMVSPGRTETVDLKGTVLEFLECTDGSKIVLGGGKNHRDMCNLFGEIRTEEDVKKQDGMIKEAVCIVEGDVETIFLPSPVRTWLVSG